ncbi:MAG TPA: hypothetical protein VNX46_19430, partial [Candidatus Acidoferrum sp.]|nr:hypothetical protein [Candidatus Acidoferrum sp.]
MNTTQAPLPEVAPLPGADMQTGSPPTAATRLVSLDAYRGFVMLLMASDGFNFSRMSQLNPDSSFWRLLAYETEHVEWRGCSLWDLIQPSFTFLVGVALPFSLAKRKAAGQSFGRMLG